MRKKLLLYSRNLSNNLTDLTLHRMLPFVVLTSNTQFTVDGQIDDDVTRASNGLDTNRNGRRKREVSDFPPEMNEELDRLMTTLLLKPPQPQLRPPKPREESRSEMPRITRAKKASKAFGRVDRSNIPIPYPRIGKRTRAAAAAAEIPAPVIYETKDYQEFLLDLFSGKNAPMVPLARVGKAKPMIPLARIGRDGGLSPIIPMARIGRTPIVPMARMGRDSPMIPMARLGRSSALHIPMARVGRRLFDEYDYSDDGEF